MTPAPLIIRAVLRASILLAFAAFGQNGANDAAPRLGAGPPSILPQCLDPGPARLGTGPSARARECTRQYCELPEYKTMIAAYAMRKPLSNADESNAVTC